MSIQGINPGMAGAGLPGLTRPRVGEEPVAQQPNPSAAQPAAIATESLQQRDVVPAEAPAGTDPALWNVLTPEERSFFTRARSLGPLTYGPGAPRQAEIPHALQGGRLDVRV